MIDRPRHPPPPPPLLDVEADARRDPERSIELAELTGNRPLRGAAVAVVMDRRERNQRQRPRN